MGIIADQLNTAMRDFNRYTGDGLPDEPMGRPLPQGDPGSGEHNPAKKQVREAFLAIAATADDLTEAVEGAAADRVQTGLDREASQGYAAEAQMSRDQAQLAALAAGLPIVTTLADPVPANGTLSHLQTGPGGQLWEVVAGVWDFVGWIGRVKFDSITALKLSTFSFADNLLVSIEFGGGVLQAVATGGDLSNAGGQEFIVVSGPRFLPRYASTLAELAQYPDGTRGTLYDTDYEADSTLIGVHSAGDYWVINGLKAVGKVCPEHFGGVNKDNVRRCFNWVGGRGGGQIWFWNGKRYKNPYTAAPGEGYFDEPELMLHDNIDLQFESLAVFNDEDAPTALVKGPVLEGSFFYRANGLNWNNLSIDVGKDWCNANNNGEPAEGMVCQDRGNASRDGFTKTGPTEDPAVIGGRNRGPSIILAYKTGRPAGFWDGPKEAVTISFASPAVFTKTAHGLEDDAPVAFSTTGALPAPLVADTAYYVVNSATDTFNVSATPGGAAIATTNAGSGAHTVRTRDLGDASDVHAALFESENDSRMLAPMHTRYGGAGAVVKGSNRYDIFQCEECHKYEGLIKSELYAAANDNVMVIHRAKNFVNAAPDRAIKSDYEQNATMVLAATADCLRNTVIHYGGVGLINGLNMSALDGFVCADHQVHFEGTLDDCFSFPVLTTGPGIVRDITVHGLSGRNCTRGIYLAPGHHMRAISPEIFGATQYSYSALGGARLELVSPKSDCNGFGHLHAEALTSRVEVTGGLSRVGIAATATGAGEITGADQSSLSSLVGREMFVGGNAESIEAFDDKDGSTILESVPGGTVGNRLKITRAGAAAGYVTVQMAVVEGKTYQFGFEFQNGTASGRVYLGNTTFASGEYTGGTFEAINNAAVTSYSKKFKATGPVLFWTIAIVGVAGTDFYVDELTIKEVLPEYSDNAAAIAGGLTAGDRYLTGADPDWLAVVS